MHHCTYCRATELLEAQLDGGMVALDNRVGACFGFDAVATDVWRQLVGPKTFEEMRDKLLREYDVSKEDCERDLSALLEQLISEGLVEKVDGSSPH